MKSSTITLLPLLAIAAACGGSGSDSTAAAIAPPPTTLVGPQFDEQSILGKIYDANYTVPEGFFIDERAETTTRSYTVHHVLDPSASYELCSDDLVEAQVWEAADNAARAVSGYYVTSHETDRYFEFVRELDYDSSVGNITDPTSPAYARVFKCSYANRDGVDRSLLEGYSGQLSNNSTNPGQVSNFVEYLWQFRFFNVSRKVVLESQSNGPNSHTLHLGLLVNQGAQSCDRVDVVAWRFDADNDSGEVQRQFEIIHSFEADNSNGSPTLCK